MQLARIVKTIIPDREAGLRVDEWLARRFSYRSLQQWQQIIAEEKISINETVTKADSIIYAGDLVEFRPGKIPEPPVNKEYRIIHRDQSIIIVDKPGLLPCHPAGVYFRHTLWFLLREAGVQKPHLVNRLDRESSGLIIVALNSGTVRQLQNCEIRKFYRVIVHGENFPETLAAHGWLLPDRNCEVRKKRLFIPDEDGVPPSPEAESCHTSFTCLERKAGFSMISAELHTGRTHQIRASLCSLGFPIVGDKLYGLDPTLFLRFANSSLSPEDHRKLIIPRQALHAFELRFAHPENGKPCEFKAPLPQCFRDFFPE